MGTRGRKDERTERSLGSRLLPLLLVVVGAATYAGSLDGPFIYDDLISVEHNPSIRGLWPPGRLLEAPPDSPVEARPVVNLTLALNYAWGELDVRGYHAVNVALHIACALLLFGIVRRTLLGEKLRPRFGPVADGIALASALVWMVHPLATECVAYISQRTESVMALFYLGTLYCAIRASDSPRRGLWMVAATVSCALAMASKEVAVTAPFVVLLYDLVFQPGSLGQILRRRWPLYAGLAATWLLLAALMVFYPHQGTVGFTHGVSSWQYALNQCLVITHYLRLAVWPHPLAIDYGFPLVLSPGDVWPQALLLLGLLVATVAALVYRPMIGFLLAWVFVVLSPSSSFVPLHTEAGAERRMYLPLAGLVVLAVVAVYLLLERIKTRPPKTNSKTAAQGLLWEHWQELAVLALVTVALVWATMRRNAEYDSDLAIWQSAVAATPDNARAQYTLGTVYARRQQLDKAQQRVERALELLPDYVAAHYNLAIILQKQNQFELAVQHFERAIQFSPQHAEAHLNLGELLQRQGKLEEAADHYRRALKIKPNFGLAHNNLGAVLQEQGNAADAEFHFREALRVDPKWAVAHYTQALQANPNQPEVHNNLGAVYEMQDELAKAESHYRQAIRLNPNFTGAQRNLQRVRRKRGQTTP